MGCVFWLTLTRSLLGGVRGRVDSPWVIVRRRVRRIPGEKLPTAVVTVRALAMTPLLSRIVSKWFKSRNFSNEEFFNADGAGEQWRDRRKRALDRLAGLLQTR
jgi:hypothetical protein